MTESFVSPTDRHAQTPSAAPATIVAIAAGDASTSRAVKTNAAAVANCRTTRTRWKGFEFIDHKSLDLPLPKSPADFNRNADAAPASVCLARRRGGPDDEVPAGHLAA